MRRSRASRAATSFATLVVLSGSSLAAQAAQPGQPLSYPKTATVPHVDDYHGSKIADPFRWLEDDTASAVKAWVKVMDNDRFDLR